MNRIEIKNVSKRYGSKAALCDVTLTIDEGMFGLLGRNGAGKTTLMKLLCTLTQKSGGEIKINGIPVEKQREIRSLIGYLPQDFNFYPSMRVEECLDYLGALSGMERRQRREKSELLLSQVNLSDSRRKKVKELSGGMRRRLGIAAALLHDPSVLIVDEPTAGLDPEERIRFRNLLCDVAAERIVLLSTHIVGDIEATCEKIAVLNEGKILYNGTVSELTSRAKGKTFTANLSREQLSEIRQNYMVTEMLTQGNSVLARIISEEPPRIDGLSLAEPNVEDGYMLCLCENGVKTGGAL